MRKTWIILLALASVLSIQAETSSMMELSVGGGWSTLGYQLNTSTQPSLSANVAGSYGLDVHVGYGLMFNRYIGLGLGVDVSRYASVAQLGGDALWRGVTDTDGELYDHCTQVSNWTDQQELYMLEVPVSLYLRAPATSRTAFSAAIGVKIGTPLSSKANYSGELKHTAGYEPWQLVLEDVKGHGFYSSSMSGSYDLQPKVSYAAFVKAGVETALNRNKTAFFFAHAYFNYYFTGTLTCADPLKDLGFKNDTQDAAMQEAHQFMSDYTSILDTKLTNGKAHPMSVGLEVGIRFRMPHKKAYSCHCVR